MYASFKVLSTERFTRWLTIAPWSREYCDPNSQMRKEAEAQGGDRVCSGLHGATAVPVPEQRGFCGLWRPRMVRGGLGETVGSSMRKFPT